MFQIAEYLAELPAVTWVDTVLRMKLHNLLAGASAQVRFGKELGRRPGACTWFRHGPADSGSPQHFCMGGAGNLVSFQHNQQACTAIMPEIWQAIKCMSA